VYTAAPVRCPRADPLSALEPLRQHVTGAVAWRFDRKLRPILGGFRPPRYDALLEFRLGQADVGRDAASALAHFERAAALDPVFDLAQWKVVDLLPGAKHPWEEAEKALAALEANLGRMVPVERAAVRYMRANLDGRVVDEAATLREWAALSESPELFQLDIGRCEIAVNRPAEAIRAISSLSQHSEALEEALEYSLNYSPEANLAIAYHLNHDYTAQLKVAQEGQRLFPGVLDFYSEEAGALAALGRLDEVEKVIEACEATQGGFRAGTPGGVMLTAASELRAHGHREAARKIAERAVAWYRSRPATEATNNQEALMHSLQQSERWAEAKAIADALLTKNPEGIGARGVVATFAARLGDVAQARRIDADLAALTPDS